MKILIAASEAAPIIKLGGLGDVVGSLPKALERLGVRVAVVIPYFPTAVVAGLKVYKSLDLLVPFNGESHKVGVYATKLPRSFVDVFLLKNDDFFSTVGKTASLGIRSEVEVFSFFARAVVELIKTKFNTYDLVHCNDWHTGLIAQLLQDELGLERPATVMTIHNFSYQGIGDARTINEVGLDPSVHQMVAWDIADGDVNMLMQGIASADFVTTVSPTYAKELLASTDEGKIFDVLCARKDRFIGILNGIDYDAFPRPLDIMTYQVAKESAKQSLLTKLNMTKDDAPIFSMISRLDPNQKGLDILIDAIPEIVSRRGRFILLGSGNVEWEEKFKALSVKYSSTNISINTVFDPELAKQIYTASDFFVIPSKFEPCGLTQMISMWYGAVPVAHSVGGLRDTIAHGKTGFLFDDYSAGALVRALDRCFAIYKSQVHSDMIEACLKVNFSFDKSALAYKALYEKAIQLRQDAFVAED